MEFSRVSAGLIRTALLVLAACFFDQSEKASVGTSFALLRQGQFRGLTRGNA
jgi:hypothetical protein